jgi:hypothetical protein
MKEINVILVRSSQESWKKFFSADLMPAAPCRIVRIG